MNAKNGPVDQPVNEAIFDTLVPFPQLEEHDSITYTTVAFFVFEDL